MEYASPSEPFLPSLICQPCLPGGRIAPSYHRLLSFSSQPSPSQQRPRLVEMLIAPSTTMFRE